MADPSLAPIVKELLQAGWRLGIQPKATRYAPKGTPPGRHAMTVREIHDLIRPKPARPHVVDGDRERLAEHEAGHAAIAHGLGWKIEFAEIRANGGLVRTYPPDRLLDDPAEQRWEESVIQSGGVASTGGQFGPGAEEDRFQVRSLGSMTFEDAQDRASRVLKDPWVANLRYLLIDALMAHGRLEGAELRRVLREAD
jgi:hypothetical protein